MVFPSLNTLAVGLAFFSYGCFCVNATAQENATKTLQTKSKVVPQVLGYGVGAFAIGEELFRTDFSDASQWAIQVEKKEDELKERIEFRDGILDLYMPGRGCTAWLKQKFSGPITITYQVMCPADTLQFPKVQARDINNFWHCSGVEQEGDIFDPKLFNGGFRSYSKMRGWYASTGGGGRKGNQTTRFRRYPREVDGKPSPHIALNDHDGKSDFLIKPGKWYTVQLVAFDDLIQYIFDGKVVYQIRKGDQVSIEVPPTKPGAKRTNEKRAFDTDEFPVHTEGYFGFRMTWAHHRYRGLVVNRLDAIAK